MALPAHVVSNLGHALQSSMGRATGCRWRMNKKMTRKRRARQDLSWDLTAKKRAGRPVSSGLSQKPAQAVEHHCGEAFVRRERPAVHFYFVNRLQRHAEIQIVKRAVTLDAAQPAGQIGDFLDFVLLAGMKRDLPVVAAEKAVGVRRFSNHGSHSRMQTDLPGRPPSR